MSQRIPFMQPFGNILFEAIRYPKTVSFFLTFGLYLLNTAETRGNIENVETKFFKHGSLFFLF